jgi:ketopantoate reductase
MAVPSVEEAQSLLGDSFLVRAVGANLAIEPKLARGQTDEARASLIEQAQAKFESLEGVRLNTTSKTIVTLWVNEPIAQASSSLKAENDELRNEMAELRAMVKAMQDARKTGAVENLGKNADEVAPF